MPNWNNVPYSTVDDGLNDWAFSKVDGQILSATTEATIVFNKPGEWVLTDVTNGITDTFNSVTTAASALYALQAQNGNAGMENITGSITPSQDIGFTLNGLNLEFTNGTWEDFSTDPVIEYRNLFGEILGTASPSGSANVTLPSGTRSIVIRGSGASPTKYLVDNLTPVGSGIGVIRYDVQSWNATYGNKMGAEFENIRSNPTEYQAENYTFFAYTSGSLGATTSIDKEVNGTYYGHYDGRGWTQRYNEDHAGMSDAQYATDVAEFRNRQNTWLNGRLAWLQANTTGYETWMYNIDLESFIFDRLPREVCAWANARAWWLINGTPPPFYEALITNQAYGPSTRMMTDWSYNETTGEVGPLTFTAKGETTRQYIVDSINDAKTALDTVKVSYYNHPFRWGANDNNKLWTDSSGSTEYFTESEWEDFAIKRGEILAGLSYVTDVMDTAVCAAPAYYTGYRFYNAPYNVMMHPRYYRAILEWTSQGMANAGMSRTKVGLWTTIDVPVYDCPLLTTDVGSTTGSVYEDFGTEDRFAWPVDASRLQADISSPDRSLDMQPICTTDYLKWLAQLAIDNDQYVFGWANASGFGNFWNSVESTRDTRMIYRDNMIDGHDWDRSKYKARKPLTRGLGLMDTEAHQEVSTLPFNSTLLLLGGKDQSYYSLDYTFIPDADNTYIAIDTIGDNGVRWLQGGTQTTNNTDIDTGGTFPRFRDYGNAVLVDVDFTSEAVRDAWVASVDPTNVMLRVTDQNGKQYDSYTLDQCNQMIDVYNNLGLNGSVFEVLKTGVSYMTLWIPVERADNGQFAFSTGSQVVGTEVGWASGQNFTVELGYALSRSAVNRYPYIFSAYAANPSSTSFDLNNDPATYTSAQKTSLNTLLNWGLGSGSTIYPYTKTPVDNSGGEMESSTTNGVLKYYEDRFVNNFDAAGREYFHRVCMVNPGGFVNYLAATPHFSPNSGYSLLTKSSGEVRDLSDNVRTSLLDPTATFAASVGVTESGRIPTPFTVNGRTAEGPPTGAQGDRAMAFKYANNYLRDNLGNTDNLPTIQAYTGYKVPYTDTNFDTYDYDVMAFKPYNGTSGWERIRIEGELGEYRKDEAMNALHKAGFSEVGYDTGGKISIESGYPVPPATGDWFNSTAAFARALPEEFRRKTQTPMMEAIFRNSGNQYTSWPESDSYQMMPYLALYGPVIVVRDEETELLWGTSNLEVNEWLLDPTRTEVHAIFRWGDLTPLGSGAGNLPSGLTEDDLTENQYQRLMWTAFHRGFIIGINQATFPPDMRLSDNADPVRNTWTVGNFQSYVRQLGSLDPLARNETSPLNPYPAGACSYPLHDAVQAFPQQGSLYGTEVGWEQGITLSGYMYDSPSNLTLDQAAAKTVAEITTQLQSSTNVPLFDKYANPVAPYDTDLRKTVDMIAFGPGEKVFMWDVEEPAGFVISFTQDLLDEYVAQGNVLDATTTLADVTAEPTCADIWTKTKTAIGRRIMVHKNVFPDYKMAVYGLPTFSPNGNENPTDTNYGPQGLRYEMYMDILNYTDATDTNGQKVVSYIDIMMPKYYPLGNASANNCLLPHTNPTSNRYTAGIQLVFEHIIPQMLQDLGTDGDHLEFQLLCTTAAGGTTTDDWPSANALLRPAGHLSAFDVPGFLQTLLQKQAEYSWNAAGMDSSRLRRLGIWLNQARLGTTANGTIYTQDGIDIVNAQFDQTTDVWDQMILRSGDPDWHDDPISVPQPAPNTGNSFNLVTRSIGANGQIWSYDVSNTDGANTVHAELSAAGVDAIELEMNNTTKEVQVRYIDNGGTWSGSESFRFGLVDLVNTAPNMQFVTVSPGDFTSGSTTDYTQEYYSILGDPQGTLLGEGTDSDGNSPRNGVTLLVWQV